MIAELISVGTELLLGNIVNTNAAYLAQECAQLGLSCYYQSVVGDNMPRLRAALLAALERSQVVILTGGLGPTTDDLTKETAADALQMPLEMDRHSMERIEAYFAGIGASMTENNRKQALVPHGAIVLDNDNGTAPGLILEKEEKRVILLPGPPNELRPMFEKSVRPYLAALCPGTLYTRTVKICGMGESKVAARIQDLIDRQTNPTVAPYAKSGEVHLRVTARAQDEKEGARLVKPLVRELKERFGMHVYTTDPEVTLERAVVDLLLANRLTVSTVESCTGGMLSSRLINVPGVSEVFKSGFITYSNKAKRKIVGVKKSLLQKYGAVSLQVAEEMAAKACSLTKSDVSVSVTGIAGPDGGTKEKPVGLVYIGCCVCKKTTVKEYHFSGDRAKIRELSVAAALTLMRQCILEYYSQMTFGKQ